MSQSQKRKAGLRLEPASARLAVCRLGRSKLSSEPMQLALAIEGLGGGARVLCAGAALPRLRIVERVPPFAVQLGNLGAVHQAGSDEAHHVGLLMRTTGPGRRSVSAPRLVRARQPTITP